MRILRILVVTACVLALAEGVGLGQTAKNGLQLSVTKKTVARNNVRHSTLYTDQIDRTMGLKVVVKNVSSKEMPEGVIEYGLLVRKYDSTTYQLYSGTEKVPALKIGETAEVVIGAAQVTGWRDVTEQRKDKLEYQVVVKLGGAELNRISSLPAFDTLAARADKVAPPKK